MKITVWVLYMILTSCAIITRILYAESPPPETALHKYTLRIVDQNSSPIEGATVTYHLQSASQETPIRAEKTTPSNGVIAAYMEIKPVHQTHITEYRYASYFDYEITKDGYNPQKATVRIASNARKEFTTEKITLVSLKPIKTVEYTSPLDYFDPSFIKSQKGAIIKSQLLNVIDSLLLESYLADSSLKPHSIRLTAYESKDYLTFRFTNSLPFDGTKLSHHEIGTIMVEKVIKKILKPLGKINPKNIFFGYNLLIEGSAQNAIDSPEKFEYSFFTPATTARKYRNNVMTDQEFIDESILFCNGNRIRLDSE